MEVLLEEIIIYSVVFISIALIMWYYMRKMKSISKISKDKIEIAKQDGVHEPISLHPEINPDICIGSGACISACPEHDILGIVNGRATLINASQCIGHGACFHACPVQAISLVIGTEKRGVDLPHVSQSYETNVQGIYIAGELGGMGLIKNAVEQGKQAAENLIKTIEKPGGDTLDLLIVGAGPAGISAALKAKEKNVSAIVLEQDTLGGTVSTFPRSKIVMTSPMNLPLYGKARLFETKKSELLDIWNNVIKKHDIKILEHSKVESINKMADHFEVIDAKGNSYKTKKVLLAIGRRGSPRKLGVKGELSEKVAYKMMEPEIIENKNILVVGGGDSAIESALLVADKNNVILSYRGDKFGRLKPKNGTAIATAVAEKKLKVLFESNIVEIKNDEVLLKLKDQADPVVLKNDLVYIFAGGELPTQFLQNAGIEITKRFGYTVKKHH